MRRRRYHGLSGRAVEHSVEYPSAATAAAKRLEEIERLVSRRTGWEAPSLPECDAALAAFTDAAGSLALARCLDEQRRTGSFEERAEVSEIEPFLATAPTVAALTENARAIAQRIEVCYNKAGARSREERQRPPTPFVPRVADDEQGLIEFGKVD